MIPMLIVRVDMEMHRCLPVLQEQNMGAGKTPEELEKDRPLVIGARVWLAVSPTRPSGPSSRADNYSSPNLLMSEYKRLILVISRS